MKAWIHNAADRRAYRRGYRFDLAAAERAREFLETFCSNKDGTPFELLEWQWRDVVGPLFGWKREGLRRFRKAYVEIAKKNGKSTLAAALALLLLAGDGEPVPEVYCTATSEKQARIVWGVAARMVHQSDDLAGELQVNRSTSTIVAPDLGFLTTLSSRPRSTEGFDAHAIIIDELHAWHGRDLYDSLQWADSARKQPLLLQITTAGNDPTSVCKVQHDYALGVLDGTIDDDRFLAAVYAADEGCDLLDEKQWSKANPSLGHTITLDSFRRQAAEAAKQPSTEAAFRQRKLNQWQSAGSSWIGRATWLKCSRSFELDELQGVPAIAGLDLSKIWDSSSLQLVFQLPGRERYRVLSYFWLPEETARKQQQQGLASWVEWADAGFVSLTPGNVIDYSQVLDELHAIVEPFQVLELAYDPTQAEMLTQQFEAASGIPRVEFAQSMTNLADPTTEFERLVRAQQIEHLAHPVQSWQVGNARVKRDHEGRIRPVKPSRDDHRKIDGVVAAVMALGRWQQRESESAGAWVMGL